MWFFVLDEVEPRSTALSLATNPSPSMDEGPKNTPPPSGPSGGSWAPETLESWGEDRPCHTPQRDSRGRSLGGVSQRIGYCRPRLAICAAPRASFPFFSIQIRTLQDGLRFDSPLKCDIASSGVIWAAVVRRNVT